MADNPQPRGFDVNQPGSTRETFIGLLQGATTDLGGGLVDLGAAGTQMAEDITDPRFASFTPTLSSLAFLNPFMQSAKDVAGSDALGSRVFGSAPTEELQAIRDDARLVGGVAGLGEIATAKLAGTAAEGVGAFARYLRGADEVAVTPDGTVMPVPLPDTSVTEMLASTDTPGINPKYLPGLKKQEAEAKERLEAGEDPRVVFEETGFMRINVDARPDRAPGDAPLETRLVFDIPDNLGQINFRQVLPESVDTLSQGNASGARILDAFEDLKDPRNFFVERGYKGGKYGRSVKFKLSDVMGAEHPLFDVFPGLGDELNVRIVEDAGKGVGGHWDEATNTIAIDAENMASDRYTSTLFVHELMHVLQSRGQLPGGSSPFLIPQRLSGQIYDNFALLESVKAMEGDNFNVASFLIDGRPKGEQRSLRTLIETAKFNVKNANPAAPDNLSEIWPGSLDSSAPVNLETMPYAQEMRAELLRLIAEKEAKTDKKLRAFEALGIDPFRIPDETGNLRSGLSAQSNYFRTRGEFTARLAQAYALATEGMTPDQRRKLFPMDLARPLIPGGSVPPSKDVPGGSEGIMGTDVGQFFDVRAGDSPRMEKTTFVDPSELINKINEIKSLLRDPNLTFPVIPKGDGAYESRRELEILLEMYEGQLEAFPRGEIPASEMGLVDIGSARVGDTGGLINVDKLPPEMKEQLDYPVQGSAVKKAEGGVVTLADMARNMTRGPKGVNSLAPLARKMQRPMVS